MSFTAKSVESATQVAAPRGTLRVNLVRSLYTDFYSFVEYETAADLAAAVEKLDNHTFKDATVRCISDVSLQSLPGSLSQRV